MPRKTYRPVGFGTSTTCFLWCRLGDLLCLTSPTSKSPASPLNWERGAVEGGGDGSFPVCTTGVCSGSTTFDSILVRSVDSLSFFPFFLYSKALFDRQRGVPRPAYPSRAVLSEKLGRNQSEARTYQQRRFRLNAVAHWVRASPGKSFYT